MLNIEKYKEELENIGVINPDKLAVIDGKPCMCQETECNMCELRSVESCCVDRTDNWLFSEYKEQEVDWSKVEVDTPILVRNTEKEEWQKRHFAKDEDGKVYTWDDGMTSWTANGEEDDITSWDYAKLAESEEYMNNSQIIEQLESIKQNALEFTRQKNASEVWSKDVEALDEAINVLSSNGWIPCKERLPETFKAKAYLTTNEDGMIGVSYYHHGWSNGYESVFDVIAWQPLPEPYEEEQ